MEYTSSVFLLILSVLVHSSFSDVSPESNLTQTLQKGMHDFAVKLNKLIQQKNKKNENVLFSPFNIYTGLALVHLGSDGITRDEVSDVMGIPKDIEVSKIHQSLKTSLLSVQESREIRASRGREPIMEKVTKIKIANGIFVHYGTALKDSYKTDLSNYYNSETFGVDFINKAKEATDIINQYVANKTENQIPQLYPEPVSTDTRIVLTTSLYFNSLWEVKFNKNLTQTETFHSESGDVNVSMMHREMEMPYGDFPDLGAEACRIWFADNVVSMIIIMPYENQTLNDLMTKLTHESLKNVIDKTRGNYFVNLKLPRTIFKWSKTLNEELIELGAKSMFTAQANLKNMIVENNLSVTEVSHATQIKINEDGTEASAVTAFKVGFRSAARRSKAVFHVNRPFLTLIHHNGIDSILFFGSVHNPNGN